MSSLMFLPISILLRLLLATGVVLLLCAGVQALVAVGEFEAATGLPGQRLATARRLGTWGIGFLVGNLLLFGSVGIYLIVSGTGGHP